MRVKTGLELTNDDTNQTKEVVVKNSCLTAQTLFKGLTVIGIGVIYLVRSAFKRGVGAGLGAYEETLYDLDLTDASGEKVKAFKEKF